jgi:hypothetical protein
MKKIILSLFLAFSLSGCIALAGISALLPSGWDANQSAAITDIQQKSKRINCKSEVTLLKKHLSSLDERVEWLIIYSESKKTDDIFNMTNVYNQTLKDMIKRVETKSVSNSYCENKKTILIEQSYIISKALQGRN